MRPDFNKAKTLHHKLETQGEIQPSKSPKKELLPLFQAPYPPTFKMNFEFLRL